MTEATRSGTSQSRPKLWRLASGVAALSVACGDDLPSGAFVVHQSEHFVYHERAEGPLCPTLLARLDEHVELIGRKIGLELEQDAPFHYFHFEDLDDFEANSRCDVPDGLRGCASRDTARSVEPLHAHELVHAYVFRAWGRPSVGLLTEGVAAALSCEPFVPLQPGQSARDALTPGSAPPDWRDLLHIRGDTNAGYAAASFFVTYLVQRQGWASLAELYRRVSPAADAEAFAGAIGELYSVPVDELWSTALETPGRPSCEMDWPCLTTELEPGSEATRDCDGEFHRRIELDASGGAALSLHGSEVAARLIDCTAASPTIYELSGGFGRPISVHWASMPAGSYALMRSAIDLPDRVEFRARLATDWISATCADAAPVTLHPEASNIIDFPLGPIPFDGPATTSETAWIRIDGGSRRYDVETLDLAWSENDPEATLELCETCGASDCIPLTRAGPVRATLSSTAALGIRRAVSLPPPSEAWSHVFFHPVSSDQ